MKEIWVESKGMAKKLGLHYLEEKGKWTEVAVRAERDIPKIKEAQKAGAERIVIQCERWALSPAKQLIALSKKTKLIARVGSSDEARSIPSALGKSLAGFYLFPAKEKEVDSLKRFLEGEGAIPLEQARVTLVKRTVSGERSCIDTCEILHDTEGMLVGSEGTGFFLVQSKSVQEANDPEACPFRVKAGAVSLYTLMDGGKTRFLGDIKAGDDALIADSSGKSRKALVGRNRIERRPMLLIEAKAGGRVVRAILQNSESVYLATGKGSKSVTSLKKGDFVLVHIRGQKQAPGTMEK